MLPVLLAYPRDPGSEEAPPTVSRVLEAGPRVCDPEGGPRGGGVSARCQWVELRGGRYVQCNRAQADHGLCAKHNRVMKDKALATLS